MSASGALRGRLGARIVEHERVREWADPLLLLAAVAVAGDTVIELVDPYRVPPPMAHLVVPALFAVFLGHMLLRRAPAEAWLSIGVAAATLAEVNENSLDLSNVQLFQSFFNSRTLPLPVSPFDLLCVVAAVLSLPLVEARMRRWRRPPEVLAVALIALLGALGFAAVLFDRAAYDTARDLRPMLVVPALLLLAAPALAGVPAARLARLAVGVAALKAAEGWLRMLLAVGVPHQGVHIVFYDITNDLVVVLGIVVVLIAGGRASRAARALAVVLLAAPVVWSFRRGVFAAAAGLLLAAAGVGRTWRAQAALLGLAVAFVGVAAGMNTVLEAATALPVDRVTPGQVPTPTPQPSGVARRPASPAPSPAGPARPRPTPARPAPVQAPVEAGDIDASNKFRLLDAKNAVLNVVTHPLFGLGPGTDYRVYDDGGQPNSPFLAYARHTSHVGYLAVALKSGLVGLGLYAALSLVVLAHAWRAEPGRERDVLLASVLFFGLLNAVFPLVATIRPAVLLGLLLARMATRPLREMSDSE